jgi:hypothetical protein
LIASLFGAAAPSAPARAAAEPPWDPFFAQPAVVADFGAATRPFGLAAADFDGDATVDLVVGRTTGNVALLAGNGDGSFASQAVFGWKQAFFNAWAFAAADVNGDGYADVVWGANASSSGCSVSPIPSTGCPSTVTVNDGEVRAWLGNGDGTFAEQSYFVSGVRHNAGILLADIGTDAGSVAAGDVDGDGDIDVLAGAIDGSASVVRLLRNDGASFSIQTLISQPTATAPGDPIYFPAVSTQNSPWGLAMADADGDGDLDLWIGDRALYVYLYLNDGTGTLTLKTPNDVLATRPNVYLRHDTFRAAVGFTPSLASADVDGDGRADLAVGLHSGTQTPTSGTAHDGEVLLNVSAGGRHDLFGPLADIGTMARGMTAIDVDGDGFVDLLGATYEGKIQLLRQLTPLDTDGDGISDYVDNAPTIANAPRIDMNTDGSINYQDQLDNDFDTILGDPEDPATWQRLGDPADSDDDNDGIADVADNCPFVAGDGQGDTDGDGLGDACDPLLDGDPDGDGVPTGPSPGDPGYEAHLAAKIAWSRGDTHFVIRIDALGRFFQNEFTQLMTDAATLSEAEWAAKCWENYGPGGGDPADPCGTGEGTSVQTLTLPGGVSVPITLVTIPKQLWTDPPVIDWINDRNDSARFELGQHGTYHFNNVPGSDWATQPDRDFFSCEVCGLSLAEEFELNRVGYDTLLGNYDNAWVAQSGATATSPRIDWSASTWPLVSYAPPFNASDAVARQAIAQLGAKAYSASVFEENSSIFTPEGSHHEAFDAFGMYHASADVELEPPDTTGDTYDHAAYADYLRSQTDDGGLTTWLIEEVEWSGRPCNNDDRLGACAGGSNRENNTVYLPRWEAWLQLLEYVRDYPGGMVMTMGEVALAQAYDNAPTVVNPDQADGDHDGIGDVIDGAAPDPADGSLTRNQPGTLSATLANGEGVPIPEQTVIFDFDADGDGTAEVYDGLTDEEGVASVSVTPTRPVGSYTFAVSWDGGHDVVATAIGSVTVGDTTALELDAGNPVDGQVTDQVNVAATLLDSDGQPVPGKMVSFAIGDASAAAVTDGSGRAEANVVLEGPAGSSALTATFAGDEQYGPSSDETPFTILREDTVLTFLSPVGDRNHQPVAEATLVEADGAALEGKTVDFYLQVVERGETAYRFQGSAVTNIAGVARLTLGNHTSGRTIRAVFAGDDSFIGSSADAVVMR